MLTVRVGDLFEHARDHCIIVHGVNAVGKMKSGFAKTLRYLYPQAYLAYYQAWKESGLKVGDLIIAVCDQEGRRVHVCHAVSQAFYGRVKGYVYVDYPGLEKALREVVVYAQLTGLPLHLPFIGGGLAQGDRARLKTLFEMLFQDVEATLWVERLSQGDD